MAENNPLAELAELCKQFRDAESDVEKADLALKAAKATMRRIAEDDIPSFMSELGVKEMTLASGEKITVSDEVYVGISKENEEKAYLWLEENGSGSIIKTVLTIQFGKGELDRAVELANELKEKETDDGQSPLDPVLSRDVHAQTLKAWMKETLAAEALKLAEGEEITTPVPLELFGARPISLAKIKVPKVRSNAS
jgi:hypothetical protein